MKILWLCNVLLPQIAEKIGADRPVLGGWLSGASDQILADNENELIVLFPYGSEEEGRIGNLVYASYAEIRTDLYDESLTKRFAELVLKYHPDVIHIWGTESAHSLSMAKAAQKCGMLGRTVASIQGLVYVYADHYSVGLSSRIQKGRTLRDWIRKDSIYNQQRLFYSRGENEKKALKILKNVIGRTEWDKESTLAVNPALRYFHCNESLRGEFFSAKKWELEECRKHTIFCAQGNYPIKGLHFAIRALALLKKQYPDVQLRVTGTDFVNKSFFQSQKKTYYFVYLRKLVKKFGLENNIVFLGSLDAEKMIAEYRNANVFLSPSTIENSSNSIGEAMLVGTPVVSSNVGGCPSIVENGKTALLYEVTDVNALAQNIGQIFEDGALAKSLSRNAIEVACLRHDHAKNHEMLMAIYKEMITSQE